MKYKEFIHRECEYYPCHDLAEWKNCLFCWCPLYLLECGGDGEMKNGIKDCSKCTIPHREGGYEYVVNMMQERVFRKG
ncbi:MAG: hypothetical protein M0042_14760 [Nitrospiraceae bacterium]|nr:hypothetical protein [Nitrospiraceae bacterium]